MGKIPRVKVVNEQESWLRAQYYINDHKIDKVKSVDFHVVVDEIPTFDFEMMGIPEIDMTGDVRFSFTPQTVQDAVTVLQNELMNRGDVYNGFLASIRSAIRDCENEIYEDELAKHILKRIIGEE